MGIELFKPGSPSRWCQGERSDCQGWVNGQEGTGHKGRPVAWVMEVTRERLEHFPDPAGDLMGVLPSDGIDIEIKEDKQGLASPNAIRDAS